MLLRPVHLPVLLQAGGMLQSRLPGPAADLLPQSLAVPDDL
jgi:hypothetical protein